MTVVYLQIIQKLIALAFLTLIGIILFLWFGLALSLFLGIPLTTALSYILLALCYMITISVMMFGIVFLYYVILGDEEDVSEET